MRCERLLQSTLWTAVVTPLTENGEVNFSEFENLLRTQEAAGNGVLILGSTGESLNLSENAKDRILNFTTSLGLEVPIMCGTGGSNLDDTRRCIEKLNTLAIDAYLLSTPLYAKPGPHGQYQWFKTLLDAADRPAMLYNVPGRTAVKMSFEAVEMLKDHENFFAIKEASGSTEDFQRYASISPEIAVYSGDDGMLPAFTPLGAKGLVSVAGNVWPEETNYYVRKCLTGTLSEDEEELWEAATNSLFMASNPVPVKRLLWQTRRISTPMLMPPLHHDDCKDECIMMGYNTKIRQWYASQRELR